jgi:hypothetical protein
VGESIRIQWEYGRDYWVELRGQELSADLRRDLQAWNDELAGMPWDGPRFEPPSQRIDDLNTRGRALAERARDELEAVWTVEYDDLVSGRVETLSKQPRASTKRHHRG